MDEDRRIAHVDEVPDDSTLLFTARRGGDEREVLLTRLGGDRVVAYENYCQHWTDVRLDKGSGAMVRGDELVCQKHGATFQTDSGVCDFGPCEGAMLPDVEVAVEDDAVYLVDDDYVFDHVGPATDTNRSSGSRIGFGGS